MLWSASAVTSTAHGVGFVVSAALQRSVGAGCDSRHHVMDLCYCHLARAAHVTPKRASHVPVSSETMRRRVSRLHMRSQTLSSCLCLTPREKPDIVGDLVLVRDRFPFTLVRHRLRLSEKGSANLGGSSNCIFVARGETSSPTPDTGSPPAAGSSTQSTLCRVLLPRTLTCSAVFSC